KRDNWNPALPFRPWLNAVARYKMIDAFRRRRLGEQINIDLISDTLPSEPEKDAPDHDLEKMLSCLNGRQRHIVRAIAIEEQPAAAVAARLAMSEGAVRVALHRALKELARLYRGTNT
ncbi:MAG: sigma-70 family RNA polymerase sigma factor, partial [Beijerinckiaceae bacterium]